MATPVISERTIPIANQSDVEQARREARALCRALGWPAIDEEVVALAVSELATNLLRYARNGRLGLRTVQEARAWGVEVRSDDDGPGIADLSLAFTDGYSSSGGLGGGLPSVRRVMDTFTISSGPEGTRIVTCKWNRPSK
jgi:serine/threonine-protein kinase RsbT